MEADVADEDGGLKKDVVLKGMIYHILLCWEVLQ